MSAITVWNKGRRTWNLKDIEGKGVSCEPDTSVTLDEVVALRLLKDYPRDFAEGGRTSGRSAAELSRWEQSIKAREKNLNEREKALNEREAALNEREKAMDDAKKDFEPKQKNESQDENSKDDTKAAPDAPAATPKRGRPAAGNK